MEIRWQIDGPNTYGGAIISSSPETDLVNPCLQHIA
jgi:hypothetical protein